MLRARGRLSLEVLLQTSIPGKVMVAYTKVAKCSTSLAIRAYSDPSIKAIINMDAQLIVLQAKNRCVELLASSPDSLPLQSVLEQLSYIEAALSDKNADRSRLSSINVGLFAVREFEARAPEFAEMLYDVEDVVSHMKSRKL